MKICFVNYKVYPKIINYNRNSKKYLKLQIYPWKENTGITKSVSIEKKMVIFLDLIIKYTFNI